MADQTTTIPKGWKMTTLGQQIKVGRGSSPRPIQDFLSDSGIPWVKIADASASETRYIVKTKEFIKEEGRSTSVKIGDLIVSNSATPGIPKFMGIDACVHDGWLVFSEYKDLDKLFLYYFFLDYRRTLEHSASGTVFVNLQTEIVRSIDLNLPPLPEQRAIAAVLSSLDDKIELLREQNKTLEATAQAIFKEWFVNFNFPGATGKMIDSELGEIPEGWKVGKLGDVVDIRGGTTPSTENSDFWNGNIYWTSPKDLSGSNDVFLLKTEKKITKQGLDKISSGLLPVGTLLLSSRAPIGYLAIANIEVAINQGYIAFLPDKYLSNYYMLIWLKLNMDTVIGSSNGSTFLEISKTSFRNIDCLIPCSIVLEEFSKSVSPIFQKLLNNTLQIETLSKLRDTLLPKLMKGEARVKGFEN